MKRKEHIFIDGIEQKWCSRCKRYLPLNLFHTTMGCSWDDKFYICANCVNDKRHNNPRFNALSVWRSIQRRVKEDIRYTQKDIKIKIGKDAFIGWYIERWFPKCQVDRINNNGHYEIDNIQLLTQTEHNFKIRGDRLKILNIIEPEGMRYCYKCKKLKPYIEFYKKVRKVSQNNLLGLSENCKECERKQTRIRHAFRQNKGFDYELDCSL